MASAAARGLIWAIPGIGWFGGAALSIAAAYVDTRYTIPRLLGRTREDASVPELLDVPVTSNEAGAPRIFAFGRRVRVPVHVLWQDRKIREATFSGGTKAGTTVPQKRVYFDAAVQINDRRTRRLRQLIGNGKLLIMTTRNLVDISTAGMVVSVSGGRLHLTMVDNEEPDWAGKFAVDDVVQLSGFIVTAGVDVNQQYWKAAAVVPHTSEGGRIELEPYFGQALGGLAATAGTAASPAKVTRVDDVMFCRVATITNQANAQRWRLFSDSNLDPSTLFALSDDTIVANATLVYNDVNATYADLRALGPDYLDVVKIGSNAPAGALQTIAAAGLPVVIRPVVLPPFANGIFPPGFVPADHYHEGTDDQGEDPLMAAVLGSGNVPGYRGQAYQVLDSFFAEQFGGQLPFSLEALQEPDEGMTWPDAVRLVLERAGLKAHEIDTADVDAVPFEGGYLRGYVPTLSAMQPMLIAGGLLHQERDGVLAFFQLARADVVQVANGADFTDLGTHLFGDTPEDVKVVTGDTAEEDLPTSVGVRHQDPDAGYALGYQPFGMRHPAGPRAENRHEIDARQLVLTRKQARNLAATALRRAHVNRRTFRVVLPGRYLHLLENDLVTWTGDDGRDVTARVIRRDMGSDWRVALDLVEEDVQVAVTGSPVQSAAGQAPPSIATSPNLRVLCLDVPGLLSSEVTVPAMKFAACTNPGGVWAGATVWLSVDGSNWTNHGTLSAQAGIGTLTGTLAAGSSAEVIGAGPQLSATSVDVEFDNVGAGVASCTLTQAVAGANWCAIIDASGAVELAAFLSATFVSGRTWTLGSMLRGLRGTSAVSHLAGATVVLLSPFHDSGVLHVELPNLSLPGSMVAKIVPAGRGLEDVPAVGFATGLANVRPLPVRQLQKAIDPTPFDVRITVGANWSRDVLPIGTQPPHPVDVLPEAYRFTLYDATGAQVRITRTVSAAGTGTPTLRDRWVVFTAAEQTAAGYTPSSSTTFVVDVQQIGPGGLLGPSIKQVL